MNGGLLSYCHGMARLIFWTQNGPHHIACHYTQMRQGHWAGAPIGLANGCKLDGLPPNL